ncbi:MAG TPA: vanadium-dependent haloperoxidase [Bryobacteraceae bacterium]|nr:vanadium-dependent haloperoxidase [Bryobacteraceae bacterium]
MKRARMGFIFVMTTLVAVTTSQAQNVVTEWNAIASNTIVQGGKMGYAFLFLAYTNIAVYDATNSIHRRFQPFYFAGYTDRYASDDAAAISAAHDVLVHYFPAEKAALDAQFEQSLSTVVASHRAKRAGVEAGAAAAQALIAARANDGLEADVIYTPGTAPGDWQPTPPGFLPPAIPWLGQMQPFTMKSASQFLPRGPYPLSSEQWVADYDLTRLFGQLNSSVRKSGQTEIGLFWTENPFVQDVRTFTYLAKNYHLGVMDSSRLMAILWTGDTDGLIGCFNAKYTFGRWRPVTAIPAGGANPELSAEPDWTPLAITPNHPEYPAAHTCGTSAISNLVADYFGTQNVHVVVDSHAFPDGVHTHTFENTADWLDEVFWARIYSGFHFHHSLEDGAELGRRVGRQLIENNFQPIGHRHHHDDSDTADH